MALFDNEEVMIKTFSMEEFVEYYSQTQVVSTEALSDYLYKIKDTFSTVKKKLTSSTNDKVVIDVTSTKYETLNIIKRLKFVEVKDFITSKPEGFTGKYVDYTLDLVNASNKLVGDAEETLNALKVAVGSFINESPSVASTSLYGASKYKETEKILKDIKNDISTYFKSKDTNTKARIKDVLKSLNDIEALYKNIEILDSSINQTTIEYIGKLSNDLAELIDSLIAHNASTKILTNNDKAKKELVAAIHIAAQEVELLSYVYSNVIIFYGVFNNLIEDLRNIEKSIN
jgi:hypothetical protein